MHMDVTKTPWYQNKLTALFGVIVGLMFAWFSHSHYQSSLTYRALPQQVFLNVNNQPIGAQNLMEDTFHNPQYRMSTTEGETPSDFLKHAILDIFTYNKE